MKTNIKIIATSLALITSVSAWAGIGGLSVQSHLGQPFSGSIVVTGDEAEALKSNRRVVVSGSGIRGSVMPQANGNVVVRLRSSSPIRDPMITFSVSAGRQTREYTAMLDPSGYTPQAAPKHVEKAAKPVRESKPKPAPQSNPTANVKAGQRDFIERNGVVAAHRADNDTAAAAQPAAQPENTRQARPKNSQTRDNQRTTTAPVATGAVKNVHKSGKAAVKARRHRAQAGETVSSIAERYRPRNMSLQTASRALAMANPSAFKRGNTIRRSTTLYIPSAAQWHAYAQRAQSYQAPKRSSEPRRMHMNAPVQAPQDNMNMQPEATPVPQPQPNVQPAPQQPKPQQSAQPSAQPKPAQPQPNQPAAAQPQPSAQPKPAQPQPNQPAAAQPQPNAQPKPAQPQPNQPAAAQPQPNAQPKPAQLQPNQSSAAQPQPSAQPAQPSATASVPAAQPNAPVQPQQPSVTSAVNNMASNPASAPAPQPVPKPMQPAMTEPADDDMEEGETDWVLYGGAAGAVLLAGLGAAHFLRKRRDDKLGEEGEDSDSDDDGVEWITDGEPTGGKTTTVHDDHGFDPNADDDDDDGVFIASETAEKTEFDLNHFQPDAKSLADDLVATSASAAAADDDDDWTWGTPESNTDDPFAEPAAQSADDSSDSDWALAEAQPDNEFDDAFSLDKISALEQEAAGEFDGFANQNTAASPAGAADDIDTMFADALAGLDSLASATQPETPTKANPAAELDDIDALFANELADLDNLASATQPETPIKANPAAELDDIDALFANELADLDNLAGSHQEERDTSSVVNPLAAADDLDALFAGKFGSQPAVHAPVPQDEPLDDIDALFAEELDKLGNEEADHEENPFAAFGSAEDEAEPVITSSTSARHELDEIDALFADELANLNALSELDQADSVEDNHSGSLNPSSIFDELAAFEHNTTPSPAPADDIDALFANMLTEVGESADKSAVKPLMSEEDIENFNSLSQLDQLESNEPTEDDLFADALDDLVSDHLKNSHSMADIDGLSFETPVIETSMLPESEETAADDVNAMAFDLSAFDALQNTTTEAAEEAVLDDIDAMSFDLSGFDALTEMPAEAELPAFDEADALAFDVPEIPEPVLETPELSTPAVDFDLPDELADLEQLTASLDELNNSHDFMEDFSPSDDETDLGFVSGSVGGEGESPESQLDIANMFIEIGDSDSARDILNKLLNHTNHDVSAKAQALLAQID